MIRIDFNLSSDNSGMSTDTRKPLTQDEADHRHMLDHVFKKTLLDPEVSRRVRDRVEKVRERLMQGPETNIALDLSSRISR